MSPVTTAVVQHDLIELPPVGLGPLVLVFRHGVVRSGTGDQTRTISGLALRTEISSSDLERNTATLHLGFHAFARLAVAPPGTVSIAPESIDAGVFRLDAR